MQTFANAYLRILMPARPRPSSPATAAGTAVELSLASLISHGAYRVVCAVERAARALRRIPAGTLRA